MFVYVNGGSSAISDAQLSFILPFIEWIKKNYIMFIFLSIFKVNNLKKNILYCAIIDSFCVISKLCWYWNKLKNAVNVCSYEPIWLITWGFFEVLLTCKMKWRNCILNNIYNVIPIQSVRFVPTNVNSWELKINTSQKSRYLRICVLDHTIIKPIEIKKKEKYIYWSVQIKSCQTLHFFYQIKKRVTRKNLHTISMSNV